ncbi:hypothetical protein BSLG_002423 [Batrachochytrium salamandrivorans]|nr:hypothetical protein BSLG_002423 [Batrachochytrium salamandrivorans]
MEAPATRTRKRGKKAKPKAQPQQRQPSPQRGQPSPQKRPSRKLPLKQQPASPPKPRTKIVVRRLPPALPRDIFLESIAKWASCIGWSDYVAGKLTKRCTEHHAVVEFAPFQRFSNKPKAVDPQMNTLDSDLDYLAFLHSLGKNPDEMDTSLSIKNVSAPNSDGTEGAGERRIAIAAGLDSFVEQPQQQCKTTPLLDAIRAEKARKSASKTEDKAKQSLGIKSKKASSASLVPGSVKISKREASAKASQGSALSSSLPLQALRSHSTSHDSLGKGMLDPPPTLTKPTETRKSQGARKREKARECAGAPSASAVIDTVESTPKAIQYTVVSNPSHSLGTQLPHSEESAHGSIVYSQQHHTRGRRSVEESGMSDSLGSLESMAGSRDGIRGKEGHKTGRGRGATHGSIRTAVLDPSSVSGQSFEKKDNQESTVRGGRGRGREREGHRGSSKRGGIKDKGGAFLPNTTVSVSTGLDSTPSSRSESVRAKKSVTNLTSGSSGAATQPASSGVTRIVLTKRDGTTTAFEA